MIAQLSINVNNNHRPISLADAKARLTQGYGELDVHLTQDNRAPSPINILTGYLS